MPSDKNPESDKAPLCPLRRHPTACCQERCAWWHLERQMCAMAVLAEDAHHRWRLYDVERKQEGR
jgi:hypothetical protein